jgi:DNA-binding transcriptional ArsR family regulator
MINKQIIKECCREGFSEEKLYLAYKIFFGTLSSESRLKIINLLRNGKKNVSEIMYELKMDQTSVSHDLARLRKCGFVEVEIEEKFRYYKINNLTIQPLMKMIEKHMAEHCIPILKSMEKNKE